MAHVDFNPCNNQMMLMFLLQIILLDKLPAMNIFIMHLQICTSFLDFVTIIAWGKHSVVINSNMLLHCMTKGQLWNICVLLQCVLSKLSKCIHKNYNFETIHHDVRCASLNLFFLKTIIRNCTTCISIFVKGKIPAIKGALQLFFRRLDAALCSWSTVVWNHRER